MTTTPSSASSVKDDRITYEEMKARARHAKREQILQPRKPLRLTKFGMFIAGIWAGAAILAIIAFVTQVSGPLAGVAVLIGTATMLAVIGVLLGTDE
jgi:hypothetical protein